MQIHTSACAQSNENRRRRSALTLLITLFFMLLAHHSFGAGYTITGRGVRAYSRGGAPVVGSDDLNAQWFNPALLAHQSDILSFYIDASLVHRSLTFTRMPDPKVMTYDSKFANGFEPVSNQRPFQLAPSIAIGTNFGRSDLMVVLGAFTQQAVQGSWPEDGPQRYTLVRSEALELIYQASVAWRPHSSVSIGAGFQMRDFLIRQDMVVSAYPGLFSWQEDRSLDALVRIEAGERMIPTAVFGLWYRPHPRLELGASFQMGFNVTGNGTIQYRKPEHYYFAPTSFSGEDIVMRLSFPFSARVGLLYRHGALWDLELSYVFTNWSTHTGVAVAPAPAGSIYFSDVPGLGTYTVQPFEAKLNFVDSHSIHLGAQYRPPGSKLEFRAGSYVETSAVPHESLTIQPMDAMKVMGGVGASYQIGMVRINLGYALFWYIPQTVTTSAKTQVNLLYGEDLGPYGSGGPSVVANGRYKSMAQVIGLSLDISLNKGGTP